MSTGKTLESSSPGLKKNSVLFLDFDGVVRIADRFCGDRIRLLADILEPTGARVVISSDWRGDGQEKCREYLGSRLSRLFHPDWCIPVKGERWAEIRAWLKDHPDFENYCILDDFKFHFTGAPDNMLDRLILCTNRHGLLAKMAPVIQKTLLR
jgi:hypothetical protein